MTPRRRFQPGRECPETWRVRYEWQWGEVTLVHRSHEFQIDSGEWYLFDRHVLNTAIDVEWVDGFAREPYGYFVAFRPERITGVRPVKKKRNETAA